VTLPAELEDDTQLVATLSTWAAQRSGRLRVHPCESPALAESEILRAFATQDWGLDPGARPSAIELDTEIVDERRESTSFFFSSLERLQKLVR